MTRYSKNIDKKRKRKFPLKEVISGLQLTTLFFVFAGILVWLFALSFAFPILFWPVVVVGLILIALLFADFIILFLSAHKFKGTRRISKMLSLGDENSVTLIVRSTYPVQVKVTIIDEIPQQFQMRNFSITETFKPAEKKVINYSLRPIERGEYSFGNINVLATTSLGLVVRKHIIEAEDVIPVFPSIIQMKKYELMAFAKISTFDGIKKVRRIGHSYEFEQIKQYVQGDDIRSVNWKATGRKGTLMVNQYEDERSQQVYTIIDKGRAMKMPFNGLSLLDYAVNSGLVISNIVIKKHDKAGLITYSNKIGSTIKAENSPIQIKKILQALYNEKEYPAESNYELLFRAVRNVIKRRSLIFLYLNFESEYAMERALPVLKKINHRHLLVVVIFENTELMDFIHQDSSYVEDIYTQTIAQNLIFRKKQMVRKLVKYGIQTILTKPEDLSINTVNKYLELKKRGMI